VAAASFSVTRYYGDTLNGFTMYLPPCKVREFGGRNEASKTAYMLLTA